MKRILCAGLIAADLVFDVAYMPEKGTKNRAAGSRLITGGGALNAASAIAALGGKAELCGVIGDDIFGTFLRQKMAERSIDDSLVVALPGRVTSRSANMITPDGDRTILNHRDAGLFEAKVEVPEGGAFDGVLVDTRWPDVAASFLTRARLLNVPGVVDAEAPVAPATEALKAASHIVFSEQGLADFCGRCDGSALEQVAKEFGVWCAVTRGALPVLYHDGHRLSQVAVFESEALDTLGAGDVWHGAFTLALAEGQPENAAVLFANSAAALKVRKSVSAEYLPMREAVDRLLRTSHSAPS
jgi:sulfofructose kinase